MAKIMIGWKVGENAHTFSIERWAIKVEDLRPICFILAGCGEP